MTTQTAPKYDNRTSAHWRDNLAGKKPPIHESDPHPGFYRCKLDKTTYVAAFVRWQDGQMICRVGNTMRDPVEQWTWLAKSPIAQHDAEYWFKTGQWKGETVSAANPTPNPSPQGGGESNERAVIGGNNPPEPTLIEQLRTAFGEASKWLKGQAKGITSKADNGLAIVKIDKLLELKGKAKAAHTVEKAPHLEAGRAVDDKYNPAINATAVLIQDLKKASGAWMAAEQAKLNAEHARQVAAAEAERKRIAAQAEAESALPPAEADLPPIPEKPKVQAGGFTGRKHGLTYDAHLDITDRAKLLRKYSGDDLVTEALLACARRDWKASGAAPVGTEEKRTPKAA